MFVVEFPVGIVTNVKCLSKNIYDQFRKSEHVQIDVNRNKSAGRLGGIEIDIEAVKIILLCCNQLLLHYNDVIMSFIASQITSLTIVYSALYSGADQRKHQRSTSLAFSNSANVSI